MATLVRVNITDPQNVIDTYGATPVYRIERDTTSAMTGASEVATGTIVAGTTEYEYRDQTGVAGTHWYRVRYSKASPSVAADYSGYSTAFQAGTPAGQIITLETAKNFLGIADTDDDAWLPLAVQAVNRAGVKAVGVDLGPSPDTTRAFDAAATVQNGNRLWIPGGIRAFTTVETGDGTTWTAVTTSVRIGPLSHLRGAGEPGAYLEVLPEASVTLDASYYIRVTGTAFATFGWDAWPDDLVQDAVAALQRMTLDRARGGQYPSEIAAMRYLHLPLWRSYSALYFPAAR